MKKKTTEISVNESSGAEKVENIEKEIKTENKGKVTSKTSVKATATSPSTKKNEKRAKGASALGGQAGENIKKINAESSNGKAEKESKEAKARVDAALKRKEAQEKRKAERKERAAKKEEARKKRMAEKKALIEKRAAEKKVRAEKHAAERKALAEKRKAEKEAKLRERAHAKANRNQAMSKKKQEKAKNRSEKASKRSSGREDRNKGYGGWIAAVVSLGVVSLALATTVTVGALDMKKKGEAMINGYRSTMYELTGIMEHVDDDLDRIRVSASPVQQSRILTDLLVQARLAEMDVEKLPMEAETGRNVTVFINRTAMECERMLSKLRNGEELSKADQEKLESLYQKNHAIRQELDKLTMNMTDKDLMEFVKDGAGSIKAALERLEQSTIEENRMKIENKIKKTMGAGTQRKQESAQDKNKKAHIEAAKAEELCEKYFTEYKIKDFQCVGETVGSGYAAYNVQGYDDKGTLLFAEISQENGALLRFDFYEDCMEDTFDIRNAERIAEEFLEKLGYDDMEVVRLRENGSTTDFTFVYEDDDVVYYPDEIRVKVCRTRGVVSGFDATKYLQNHGDRVEPNVKITLAEAYGKLREELSVEASRLAVVKTARGERTAYEFLCSYQDKSYFVFLDAVTGEEISIVNTKTIQ